MLAYHNKPELKESVVAEMAAHRKADELVQGYGYWKYGKGCAMGCLIKSGDHKEYETRFGIPEQLALLEDSIFEGLPKELAQKWPERFLESITTGADLTRVWSHFAYWMLIDPEYGQIKYAGKDKAVIDAIIGVANLHKDVTEGKRSAAESAAWSAARSAAWSAAESAAWSAAWSAAESAARSAAESAAESAAYIRMADKLIEIIEEYK